MAEGRFAVARTNSEPLNGCERSQSIDNAGAPRKAARLFGQLDVCDHQVDPGEITVRPAQVGNEADFNRVREGNEDDRDRRAQPSHEVPRLRC